MGFHPLCVQCLPTLRIAHGRRTVSVQPGTLCTVRCGAGDRCETCASPRSPEPNPVSEACTGKTGSCLLSGSIVAHFFSCKHAPTKRHFQPAMSLQTSVDLYRLILQTTERGRRGGCLRWHPPNHPLCSTNMLLYPLRRRFADGRFVWLCRSVQPSLPCCRPCLRLHYAPCRQSKKPYLRRPNREISERYRWLSLRLRYARWRRR